MEFSFSIFHIFIARFSVVGTFQMRPIPSNPKLGVYPSINIILKLEVENLPRRKAFFNQKV